PVLSDQNAPIDVPDQAKLTITSDGTVTALGAGDEPNNLVTLGRLKLVSPPQAQLLRGDDGVFRMPPQANGQPAAPLPADPTLHVTSGALESSNANPTAAMVGMIENARRFEMQMQVISESNTNADKANGILTVAG
ncbi:MAG TPA: flagellar basal body rod C-terminal domain-containing protein, partial [Rhodopila sp.]